MIHGVDLSEYQRDVGYAALAKAVGFGYVKCSDARGGPAWVSFEDSMHRTHVAGLRAHDVPTGDYGFGHPSFSAQEHAEFFIVHAWFDQLRPVIDMESLAMGKIPSNAGEWCDEWLTRVLAATGVQPIIYASTYYAQEMLRQVPSIADWDLWIAEYHATDEHPPKGPWPRVVAWQWTGTGGLPGIKGNADRDVCPDLSRLTAP